MANGFIYIMSNPSFTDGKIKIGKSQKDPALRKEELNTTGLPEPFELEYYALVENFDDIEVIVHSRLDTNRPNKNREFFNCSIPEAISVIRQSSKVKYEEVFHKTQEEIETERLLKEQEIMNQDLLQKKQAADAEKERLVREKQAEKESQDKKILKKMQDQFNNLYYERCETFLANELWIKDITSFGAKILHTNLNFVPVFDAMFNSAYEKREREAIWEMRDELKRIKKNASQEFLRKLNSGNLNPKEFAKSYERAVETKCISIKRKYNLREGVVRASW